MINFSEEDYSVLKQSGNKCPSEAFYFKESVSWSDITADSNSFRYYPAGFVFGDTGHSAFFVDQESLFSALALLNTPVIFEMAKSLSPTIHFDVGYFKKLPVPVAFPNVKAAQYAKECVALAREDWNCLEQSWYFGFHPLVDEKKNGLTLSEAFVAWSDECQYRHLKIKELEEKNNQLFIKAFGLEEELQSEVLAKHITLNAANAINDGGRLISYAIGCMMGRYSLDEPGLIYAHAGNVDFDPSRHEKKFPADADGIIPIADEPWFDDDAAQRIREFLRAVWGPETLEENMGWLAESLGKKGGETPDETIRRYLADKFFKDHLQTYKKRPIYWLFSSGKQGAFQALVYLHRYNEGTLARMRNAYVIPLTGKIAGRIDLLEQEVANASSTSVRTKAQKALDAMRRKQAELVAYDEQLRHYADMRIQLDLDDGVKVNYGKFGNLLAEVKAITGGASDD